MAYFDEAYYVQTKLKQLVADKVTDANGEPFNVLTLRAAVASSGLTLEEHYKAYGREEGLNPSAYFNESEYLQAKLNQLLDTDERDASGQPYTLESLRAVIENTGLTPAEHYETFGAFETNSKGELTNPSNAFDANAYVQAKLAEMQTAGESLGSKPAAELSAADVLAALKDAGISLVTHYIDYGAKEAGTHNVPLVQTVPSGQRVANDPAREVLGENVPGNYNPPTAGALSDGAAAKPVTKPADMGGLAPESVSPPVTPPAKPLPTPVDGNWVAPPAGLVDTNEKPVIPPTTSGTGNATDNWVVVKPDGGADIVKPDGTPGGTLPPGSLDPENPVVPDKPVTPPTPPSGGGDTGGGTGETWHGTPDGDTHVGGTPYGDTIDGSGGGADYLVGGGPTITSGDADIIYAGTASGSTAGVYNETTKSAITGYNADFLTVFNGDAELAKSTANRTVASESGDWLSSTAVGIFNNSTILEGRAGNDTLVASTQKDVFLYQTGGGGTTGLDLELSPTQLGTDTIHSFKIGQDAIFVMDQSAKKTSSTAVDQAFSAGWTIAETEDSIPSSTAAGHHDMVAKISGCGAGGNQTNGEVTLDWTSADYKTATLTIKGSTFAGGADGSGDLTINLKGIKDADANTTIAELFGKEHSDATDDIVWHGTKGNDNILGGASGDTITGGTGGADFLRGGTVDDTNVDTIFAGTRTASGGSVYAESYKDAVSGWNADFLTNFNGGTGDYTTPHYLTKKALDIFENATILEGRQGADILVASNQKDVFLYQGKSAAGSVDDELTAGDLGTDVIHKFQLGTDRIFIMDQGARADVSDATAGGANLLSFSAGWKFGATSQNGTTYTCTVEAPSLKFNDANASGSITFDTSSGMLTIAKELLSDSADGGATNSGGTDLTITLTGLQGTFGITAGTDITALFGGTIPLP